MSYFILTTYVLIGCGIVFKLYTDPDWNRSKLLERFQVSEDSAKNQAVGETNYINLIITWPIVMFMILLTWVYNTK